VLWTVLPCMRPYCCCVILRMRVSGRPNGVVPLPGCVQLLDGDMACIDDTSYALLVSL
jgi:hypothetical protein